MTEIHQVLMIEKLTSWTNAPKISKKFGPKNSTNQLSKNSYHNYLKQRCTIRFSLQRMILSRDQNYQTLHTYMTHGLIYHKFAPINDVRRIPTSALITQTHLRRLAYHTQHMDPQPPQALLATSITIYEFYNIYLA